MWRERFLQVYVCMRAAHMMLPFSQRSTYDGKKIVFLLTLCHLTFLFFGENFCTHTFLSGKRGREGRETAVWMKIYGKKIKLFRTHINKSHINMRKREEEEENLFSPNQVFRFDS